MNNLQIKKKNMVNATNVSQKKGNTPVKTDENTMSEKEMKFLPTEEEIIKKIEKGKQCLPAEFTFLIKKGIINLRIAYGVYLSMCKRKRIKKVITWRTFYMQCSGYRTLKPTTMEALSEFIHMRMTRGDTRKK